MSTDDLIRHAQELISRVEAEKLSPYWYTTGSEDEVQQEAGTVLFKYVGPEHSREAAVHLAVAASEMVRILAEMKEAMLFLQRKVCDV